MLKVTAAKIAWFATTEFFDLNFKLLYAMAVMFLQCLTSVNISHVLLLSLLKILIIVVVLLITLADLKQLIY